jgi:long-chain acyl-CoA synthetase
VTTIRIADPDENGCGEIIVRSPSVMLAYLGPSDAVDDGPVTSDRWLRTGDIGRLDADGYLYVTDRSKDVVIRGGENIATPHVEGRLLAHPAVAEVAVVGLPHPVLGEELGGVVVLRAGAEASSEELAAFVAPELAYFEVPTRWWLRREPLPQNTTGKVLKRVLRQQWIDMAEAGAASFENERKEGHGQA